MVSRPSICRSILSLSKIAHQMWFDHQETGQQKEKWGRSWRKWQWREVLKKGGLLIIGGLVPLCLLCQEILKFFHNPLPIIPGFSPFLVKISHPPITVISENSHLPLYEGQGGAFGLLGYIFRYKNFYILHKSNWRNAVCFVLFSM